MTRAEVARASRVRCQSKPCAVAGCPRPRAITKTRCLFHRQIATYGLSQADFESIFAKQGCACAICVCTQPGLRGWQVDHNHSTGTVRGILCARCNLILGLLDDYPPIAKRVVDYLEKNDGWIG